jgi:hypothetical protein
MVDRQFAIVRDVSVEYLVHHTIFPDGASIPPMPHTQKIVEKWLGRKRRRTL